jgi:hypothetical protein
MDVKIDWLSISVPSGRLFSRDFDNKGYIINSPEKTREHKLARWVLAQRKSMAEGKGRAPFSKSYHSSQFGWTYFYSDTLPYSLLEITGVGCEYFAKKGDLLPLIRDWTDRSTRIDIACDFATETSPTEFAHAMLNGKFASGANMKSETGETVYVGSRKSDRYARIYKYNPPHPRAGILRAEMVCKGDKAQSACAGIVSSGLLAVTRALGEVFIWTHPLWTFDTDETAADISVPADTHQGNTERWLLTQVASAIEKLKKGGSDDFLVYWLGQITDIIKPQSEDTNNGK